MKDNKSAFVKAAMAGVLGAAVMSAAGTARAEKSAKQMAEVAKCYGVNKCAGHGKCGGPGGNSCAGENKCKGQGWLLMPKESCLAIEGGSLTPLEAKPAGKTESKPSDKK